MAHDGYCSCQNVVWLRHASHDTLESVSDMRRATEVAVTINSLSHASTASAASTTLAQRETSPIFCHYFRAILMLCFDMNPDASSLRDDFWTSHGPDNIDDCDDALLM